MESSNQLLSNQEAELIKVIALDPGGTTGWAKGLIREGRMGVISGQDAWYHIHLYDQLTLFKPDIIVCERFEFRKGSSQQGAELISKELIGIVYLYVQQKELEYNGNSALYMQMPSEALKGYYSDEQLKKNSLYKVAKPHANDAMRHLLQWYTFKEGYQFNKSGFYRMEG